MTEKQRLVYKAVKWLGPITPHQLAKRMGFTESAYISVQLVSLFKLGLLQRHGKGKNTKYQLNGK